MQQQAAAKNEEAREVQWVLPMFFVVGKSVEVFIDPFLHTFLNRRRKKQEKRKKQEELNIAAEILVTEKTYVVGLQVHTTKTRKNRHFMSFFTHPPISTLPPTGNDQEIHATNAFCLKLQKAPHF